MKAVRFEVYGPPSVLRVCDIAEPTPREEEVLIEVRAAGINPSDVKMVAGLFEPTLPRTPGRDYAGVIVGGALDGTEVWGSGATFGVRRDGSHAQFVVAPSSWVSRKPSGLTMAQAASIGVPHVAAWSALVEAGGIKRKEVVLITGVLGAVGRAATQIARWRGATVVGADRHDVPSDASIYINVETQDLEAEVRRFTLGRGVDLALDAVGGAMFEPVLKSLAERGRQVAITSVGARRVEFDLMDFYHNRQRLIGVDTAKLDGPAIAAILERLRPGFDNGALVAPPIQEWPIEQAIGAYTAVQKGGSHLRHVFANQPVVCH